MTILPFLAIAFGAAAASLLTRRSPPISATIGILGLVGTTVAAAAINADETLAIGGGELVGSAYLRLFASLGSLVALVLALLGLLTGSHRHVPGVLLGGIGAAGLALALPDARIAVLAATAGGLVGILVTLAFPASPRDVVVAVRELRALAIAGVLAIFATAWIGRSLGTLAAEPAVFGLAYLGFAAAVAIRFGAIPFHFWAARLADAAPEVALPMLMAWGPAALAVVALAWVDQSVAPLLLPLADERGLVVAVGAVSVILGSLAAWIQDDLEHVVGYTIIADAGIAILGLAALDPAAWEPARTWILVFVVSRSAFAAWAVAIRGAYGTRRIDELRGWALRAPVLGVAFVAIVVAGIGLPGLVAWEARARLIELTLAGPFVPLVMLGALGPLAVYARLGVLGVGQRSDAVARGQAERPSWPSGEGPRSMTSRRASELGVGRAGRATRGGLDAVRAIPAAVRLNRALIAALLVLLLSGVSVAVSAGGFGVSAAAEAVPGRIPEPAETEPPGAASEPPVAATSPPATVGASSPPAASESAAPSASPAPTFQSVPPP